MKEHHFIEKFWYPSRSYRSLFHFIFWIFNLPFLLLVKLKRFLYKNNYLKSNTFSKPVLVVGNLTVGGTGKTPFIADLVERLNENNISCGIVSRGYRSNVQDYPHQVNELDSASSVGDEASMQYNNLNIPIVIDANRSNAVKYLIDNNNIDLIISDDGLQHYKMQRDMEIVLVDASRGFGNRLVIPFGPLREPVSRCQSVDLVIKNGGEIVDSSTGDLIDAQVSIVAKQFVNIKTNETKPLDDFENKTVCAVAGIGNPNRFYSTLENYCNVIERKTFKDHHHFCESDFNGLDSSFDNDIPVVMTEKDAVKCEKFAKDNWYYLEVSMQFEQDLIDNLVSKIRALIERKNNG